ncbi:MAG: hypothetical protein V4534_07345 [Myxococcota bacterium]
MTKKIMLCTLLLMGNASLACPNLHPEVRAFGSDMLTIACRFAWVGLTILGVRTTILGLPDFLKY